MTTIITVDGETFTADQIRAMVRLLREAKAPRHAYRTEQMLPESYKAEIDRVYGSDCADGDMSERGQ
jgi:hypothetical protein